MHAFLVLSIVPLTLQFDVPHLQEFAAVTRRKTGGLSGYGFALLDESGALVRTQTHSAMQQRQQQLKPTLVPTGIAT
jgi:hypothetical protein